MKKRKVKVPEDMLPGTVHQTKNNGELEIIEWSNALNVTVKFKGYEHTTNTTSSRIREGSVKNRMIPTMAGKGFIGQGKYSEGKNKEVYQIWNSMLQRCYNPKYHKKHPSYVECSVCTDWLNFQVFAEWFYEESNYEEGLHLDKDIIHQGNKVYCPEQCSFITKETNAVTTNCQSARGDYMLGATWAEDRKKFRSFSTDGKGTLIGLGSYDSELEAHEAYKKYKYEVLKTLALKQTDERVKQGLLNWVIPKY